MDTSERIKRRRTELGLSLQDVADALGVNKSTVMRYETKEIEKLPINVIAPLAKVLKVSKEYLMGWEDEESKKRKYDQSSTRNIPICDASISVRYYSTEPTDPKPISGHYDSNKERPTLDFKHVPLESRYINHINIPAEILSPSADYFALYAQDNSMINENIKKNDLMIFEEQSTPKSGMIGYFYIENGTTTCKRLSINGDQMILLSENPAYKPIIISPKNLKCLGKLAFVLSDRR